MVLAAHAKFPLTIKGKAMADIKPDTEITLRWPAWYAPTAEDRQAIANTLKTHKEAGELSRETRVASIADQYDIEDVQAELAKIAADEKHPVLAWLVLAKAARAALPTNTTQHRTGSVSSEQQARLGLSE